MASSRPGFGLNVPGWHGMGWVAPVGQKYPAGHCRHWLRTGDRTALVTLVLSEGLGCWLQKKSSEYLLGPCGPDHPMGLGVQEAGLSSPFTEVLSGGSFSLPADTSGLALSAAGSRELPLPQWHSPWTAAIGSLPISLSPIFLSTDWNDNHIASQAFCDSSVQCDRALHSTGHMAVLSGSFFQRHSITVSTPLGGMKVSGCSDSHQTYVDYSRRLPCVPCHVCGSVPAWDDCCPFSALQ